MELYKIPFSNQCSNLFSSDTREEYRGGVYRKKYYILNMKIRANYYTTTMH